ncbi:cryptochrome/deoxyribodipyrimidine photo-lyase family protein [Nitritalea halalkaliphila]|nr:deoxyribodipyrimidine photo-lyase [Nitritalea halalkaliphila]
MQDLHVVWFKRDLRLSDHAPLQAALAEKKWCLLLYFFEPELVASPHSDTRHWRFVLQSLHEMQAKLETHGLQLHILYADPLPVLRQLQETYGIACLYSHIETGLAITYRRDLAVADFCRENGIRWREFQQQGVRRGRKNRERWSQEWYAQMTAPLAQPNFHRAKGISLPKTFLENLPQAPLPQAWQENNPLMQPGGEDPAQRYLQSFLRDRVRHYNQHISKPSLSRSSCSRLSPYLAWGNLSMRQVYQAAEARRKSGFQARNLVNFQSRLRWHCHFIQKFEMEDQMEFRCVNQGFEKMEKPLDSAKVEAWKEGRTGFPLVDACMRCLKETGYLNFRMRAMLVSFLTHHLLQDWRHGVAHLARYFLDFEPGIHFPQFQMQAGVTGINTVRIYNPVKQAEDHDPEAVFISKWVPELAQLPIPYRLKPWELSPIEASLYQFQLGSSYPAPIIDLEKAAKIARDQIWSAQKMPEVQQEAKRILRKHTLPNRQP